jgi:membrane protein DedA with SNARE-associated domain
MTMESSVLPLPSESIIPLAASWSHSGKISIGIPGIIIAGALGS